MGEILIEISCSEEPLILSRKWLNCFVLMTARAADSICTLISCNALQFLFRDLLHPKIQTNFSSSFTKAKQYKDTPRYSCSEIAINIAHCYKLYYTASAFKSGRIPLSEST